MKGVQNNARYFMKIHRRLIKPPYPVKIACPACGRWFIEVNADTIEVTNDHGLPYREVKADDVWQKIKHNCGTTIVLYWNSSR